MAREIKFRAWDKLDRVMLYPGWNTERGERFITIGHMFQLGDSVEVMQYTGLTDKNGKEVYEGDVLQFSDKWEWYRGQFGGGWLATQADKTEVETNHVKYPYERRVVNLPSDYEWLLSSEIQTYFEVIGNIYENSDLLDKQT